MANMIRATVEKAADNMNASAHRKENNYAGGYMVVDSNLRKVVDCRIYWTANRCYCCLWVMVYDCARDYCSHTVSGSGFAGGCGYCKESAAVAAAIDKAGIVLNKDISGVGKNAIEDSLEAIARAYGHKNTKTFRLYG